MASSTQVSADVRPTSQPAAEQLPADVLNKHCPSRTILRHLTDRWTPLIVAVLADGEPVRFKDLKSTIQGISPKVLTETLRSMERDGLLTRHITASVPPRVDYQLTDLGLTTVEPLAAVRTWAETHLDEVLANRERFDAAQTV